MTHAITKTIACALAGFLLSACSGADTPAGTTATSLFDYPTLSRAIELGIENTFVSANCETDYCVYNQIEHEIDFMTASLGNNIILGAPITSISTTGTLRWDATADYHYLSYSSLGDDERINDFQSIDEVPGPKKCDDDLGASSRGCATINKSKRTGYVEINLGERTFSGRLLREEGENGRNIGMRGTILDNQTIEGGIYDLETLFISGINFGTEIGNVKVGELTGIADATKMIGIFRDNGSDFSRWSGGFKATP